MTISNMITSKLEVLVEFGPADTELVEHTLRELKAVDGIKEAVFKDGAVLVESALPSAAVLDAARRAAGRRAVLQGFGDARSAVAMVSAGAGAAGAEGAVVGVVRFQQAGAGAGGGCVVDGALHGLAGGGRHALAVHTAGDLSDGCNSIGPHYDPPLSGPAGDAGAAGAPRRHAGDLGEVVADDEGRASFRFIDPVLQVDDIVGRALGVGAAGAAGCAAGGAAPPVIACGVIARSAGVFTNAKRICACDGVPVWDERDRPLAGRGRRGGGGGEGAAQGAGAGAAGGARCCNK